MTLESWVDKIKTYCEKYNIPIEHLYDTINEPKVIPMIRGKAYEFSVAIILEDVLNSKIWEISKPYMNAQTGLHDIDVQVKHLPTQKTISLECKLAAKGRFRKVSNSTYKINIKCMRSRTLGESMVKEAAPKIGVYPPVLAVHNDQYWPNEFDFVITSIGNVFYETNSESGVFEWQPSSEDEDFLKKLAQGAAGKGKSLKDFAFHSMYIAPSRSLAISRKNSIVCTRRRCRNKRNCGFIPNYPEIHFGGSPLEVKRPWVPLKICEQELVSFLNI